MAFMRALSISVLLLVGGWSCVHTARVYEKSPTATDAHNVERLKGIPFFAKRQAYKQETIYQKTWMEVAVEITEFENGKPSDKPERLQSTVPFYSRCSCQGAQENLCTADQGCSTMPGLNLLKEKITKRKFHSETQIDEIRNLFKQVPAVDKQLVPWTLISNFVEPTLVVDYTRELYLNSRLPWFGTSTLTTKLASDGTLSEATVSAESKIPEAISSLVPLKEFLSAEFVSEADTAAVEEEALDMQISLNAQDFARLKRFLRPTPKYKVTLAIDQKGHNYVFSATFPTDPRRASTNGKHCPKIPDPCDWPGCLLDQAAAPRESAVGATSGKLSVPSLIDGRCKLDRLPFDLEKGEFKRIPIEAKAKPKDEKNKIKVSGEIVLPKTQGAKSP